MSFFMSGDSVLCEDDYSADGFICDGPSNISFAQWDLDLLGFQPSLMCINGGSLTALTSDGSIGGFLSVDGDASAFIINGGTVTIYGRPSGSGNIATINIGSSPFSTNYTGVLGVSGSFTMNDIVSYYQPNTYKGFVIAATGPASVSIPIGGSLTMSHYTNLEIDGDITITSSFTYGNRAGDITSSGAILANFNWVPTGLSVAFTDESYNDSSAGSITSWSWDFGDSSGTSTSQNPTYAYATSGDRVVALTVTTSGGKTSTGTIQVTV